MARFLGRLAPSREKMASLPRFGASAPMAGLPAPPSQIILTEDIATPTYAGMLGNSTAGDCTIAGLLRLQQFWSAKTLPAPLQFTDQQALADYTIMTGYNPTTGQPDPGCVETDVLDYWVKTGFNGNQLVGYTSVDPGNVTHIQQTIATYGGIYLGVRLPQSAEKQTDDGQPWTVELFSPIAGGHCIVAFEYDENYLYAGTWAIRQPITWEWVYRYLDAAYAPLDALWIAASGHDLATLTADLNYVAN